MSRNIYRDFDIFARALVKSNDVDPVYPVVRGILKAYPKYQPEWFIFVYVAFYNLETAIQFCDLWPTALSFQEPQAHREFMEMRLAGKLKKFGHERRGSCRNPKNQLELFDAATCFTEDCIKGRGLKQADNLTFRQVLMEHPWHGYWSSYKIAELFEKSLGWDNLKINDLGIDGRDPNSNDGPIGGLRWLFDRESQYNSLWYKIWNRFGKRLSKEYGWGIGETETCLCKFHKLMTGKYYVGHDVDEFYDLRHVLSPENYRNILGNNFTGFWEEGIKGVKKHQKSHYQKTGEILNSHYGDSVSPVDVEKLILEL
jgi:hypothetical protein